jgi:hypothetical protein
MPIHFDGIVGMPPPDGRAWLDTMPGTEIPVLRQPFAQGDQMPIWSFGDQSVDKHYLFDITVDPNEQENRSGEKSEEEMLEMLRSAMVAINAPDDQFERIGLS